MTTAVVFTCSHADPDVGNERFDLLGKLIYDVRPDYVVDLGDGADMRSLNSYDTRYPQQVVTQNYEADINQYLDAQERMRHVYRRNKRRLPTWYGFEGNHENRIKKAVAENPRIGGARYGVSFSHLETERWFNEYHEYHNEAPALARYDGVLYGHFVTRGNSSRAIAGKHHAAALVDTKSCSVTVGHSHKFNYFTKGDAYPVPLHGLVAGCFKGKDERWAGQSNAGWSKGVAIKRNLDGGQYDLQWVSMRALEEEYGSN